MEKEKYGEEFSNCLTKPFQILAVDCCKPRETNTIHIPKNRAHIRGESPLPATKPVIPQSHVNKCGVGMVFQVNDHGKFFVSSFVKSGM